MEGVWSGTTDTKLAACFATLGMPVRLEVVVDERRAWKDVRFHIGMTSTHYPQFSTAVLRADLMSGALEKRDPCHPLLDCIRGLRNWERLLDACKQSRPVRLVKHAVADRWTYEEGDRGFCGVGAWMRESGSGELVKSGDLKMVAALGVLGFEVVQVEGSEGQRRFYLPRWGPKSADGEPADSQALVAGFRDRSLRERDRDHPLLWAMFAMQWREKLRRMTEERSPDVMFLKPGSRRAAFIRSDAPDAEWERMKRHFQL